MNCDCDLGTYQMSTVLEYRYLHFHNCYYMYAGGGVPVAADFALGGRGGRGGRMVGGGALGRFWL